MRTHHSHSQWHGAHSLTAPEKQPQVCGHSSPICPPIPLPPPVVPAFFGGSPTCLSTSCMVHSSCRTQCTDHSTQHWSICLCCQSQRPREFSPTVLCTTSHAQGYPSPIRTPALHLIEYLDTMLYYSILWVIISFHSVLQPLKRTVNVYS